MTDDSFLPKILQNRALEQPLLVVCSHTPGLREKKPPVGGVKWDALDIAKSEN